MKNEYFNKKNSKPKFDFKQMGIDQAQKLLSVAMRNATPEQIENQCQMVEAMGIHLLANLAFNRCTETGENGVAVTDRTELFALTKTYGDEITEQALAFNAGEMEFVPATEEA